MESYLVDLDTHVAPKMETACPQIIDLLTSDLALSPTGPVSKWNLIT